MPTILLCDVNLNLIPNRSHCMPKSFFNRNDLAWPGIRPPTCYDRKCNFFYGHGVWVYDKKKSYIQIERCDLCVFPTNRHDTQQKCVHFMLRSSSDSTNWSSIQTILQRINLCVIRTSSTHFVISLHTFFMDQFNLDQKICEIFYFPTKKMHRSLL